MGARINFLFKTELDKPYIGLYSHWGADSWRLDLAKAINAAENRLKMDDIAYATRIIIDQLTKDARDSETGFGLYVTDTLDGWDGDIVEIDMTTQMVNDTGNWHSFNSFVEYQSEILEFHNV